MNSRNEDKVSMYNKVRIFLKDHIAVITPIVASAAATKTEFDATLDQLMLIVSQAGAQTTGYTRIKENQRQALERIMLKALRALKGYAIDTNLPDLLAKSEYSRSEVERFRDSELYTTSLRVTDLAAAHITAIAAYSFGATDMTNLQTSSASFYEVIQLPKDKIGERASYNKLIELTMYRIDTLLGTKMDTYMELVEFDNASLFMQYRSARSIDTSRGLGSSKTYKGIVAAGLTALALKQSYDPDRTYTITNKGVAELSFGLSLNGTDIAGVAVVLQTGDEITRDASDLNPDGEYFIAINSTTDDGAYEIHVDK